MKSIFSVFLLLILFFKAANAQSPINVSMIQLIANPQEFNGRTVRVTAFLRLEFEGDALYLHEEDFKKGIPQNGVAIDLSESQLRNFAKLNNGYVLVEGIFNAGEGGHFDTFPGTLQKVSRLSNWSVARGRRAERK